MIGFTSMNAPSPSNCSFLLLFVFSCEVSFRALFMHKTQAPFASNILESPELEDRYDRILGAIGYELIEEPEEVFEELNILEEKKCPEQGVVQGIKHDAEQVAIKLLATRLKISTTS